MRPKHPFITARGLAKGTVLSLLLTGLSAGQDTRPTEGDFRCYFGVLHSHCVLSPDYKPQPTDRDAFVALVGGTDEDRFSIPGGPMEAWTVAADEGKVDFLALTDHVHGPEQNQPEFCEHEMPDGGYRLLREAAERINADPARAGKFLAIPGIEWSSITPGNHVNIFFAERPVPQVIANGAFRNLLTQYLAHPDFEANNPLLLCQMNHPNQSTLARSYGRDEFPGGEPGEREFSRLFGDLYLGIEHINSSNNGGNDNSLAQNAHRDGNGLEQFYRIYLNMGFRLAPVGDHDNHRANWGRHTAARTGVWAEELTPEGFVEAYRARRVFATEDNEMAVVFLAGDAWMGSEVGVRAGGEERTFSVRVEQMADTDEGEVQDEGPYIVELFDDEDGPGGQEAARVQVMRDGEERSSLRVSQGESVQFTRSVRPGAYYYLHVRETESQDGGGNEADAWTAPIWFAEE